MVTLESLLNYLNKQFILSLSISILFYGVIRLCAVTLSWKGKHSRVVTGDCEQCIVRLWYHLFWFPLRVALTDVLHDRSVKWHNWQHNFTIKITFSKSQALSGLELWSRIADATETLHLWRLLICCHAETVLTISDISSSKQLCDGTMHKNNFLFFQHDYTSWPAGILMLSTFNGYKQCCFRLSLWLINVHYNIVNGYLKEISIAEE